MNNFFDALPDHGPQHSSSALLSTHRAGRWFLESGIQEPRGGVARYYRFDARQNHPVSTEITGYFVSALAYLHRLTGSEGYLEAAQRAGDFLRRTAWDPMLEIFPFECPEPGNRTPSLAYFFDCGIIVRGLLSLRRLTGGDHFLDIARSCGRSMAGDFALDGQFHPVISLPDKKPIVEGGRWSRNPGCYQLKAAMAWFELFEETGEEDFRKDYEIVLEYSLRSYPGFLTEEPDRERLMDRLHAYAYFLEGLLPCAAQPECARTLAEGIQNLSLHLRSIAPVFERSDVYAQLLRLRLFADSLGAAPLDVPAAQGEAAIIPEFQLDDPDVRIGGGFCFGRKAGAVLPYANPVSTSFCVQALEMWRQYQAGSFGADRLTLI